MILSISTALKLPKHSIINVIGIIFNALLGLKVKHQVRHEIYAPRKQKESFTPAFKTFVSQPNRL